MKLYGTTTSPFVRRVRVAAAEVDEPVELIDTATEPGQAALRAVSPIWKVPVAEIDGRTLFDSRVIVDWLVVERGYGRLAPPADAWHEANLVNAIDGALESAIQVFYLRREGIPVEGLPFAQRQADRIAAIFDWVIPQLAVAPALDLPTLSLLCTLDWMDFRKTYPTQAHPALAPLRAAWAEHPALVATRPHT